jgi:hypothetical protein
MIKRFHTVGLLSLVALSAMAFAVVDGLTIKRAPKEGQTFKYKMEGNVDMQGTPITLKGTMQEKVVKVEANGNYAVEQQQLEGKIVLPDGNEMDMPAGNATTTTYKANGEVIEIKGASEDSTAYRMSTLGLLVDPGKQVNVGDKWTFDVKADAKTGAAAAKAEFQALAEEKVGTIDTIKVKAVVKESEGSEPASSESTIWIDKKDGSTVKTESKWVKAPFPGPTGPMILDATLKLTRID